MAKRSSGDRGGGGGGNGSGLETRGKRDERKPYHFVIEVPRIQNGIQIGDNLAHKKATHLANAYLERTQYLASRQTFICAADRFIRSQKNGHFLCLSALFPKEITIFQNRYADKNYSFGVRR